MAVTGKDLLAKKGNRGRTPRSYDQGCNYPDAEEGDGQLVNPESGFGQKEKYKNTIIILLFKFFKYISMQNKYNLCGQKRPTINS